MTNQKSHPFMLAPTSARAVPMSRAFDWYKNAWQLFKKSWGQLILFFVVYFAFSSILTLIPWVGLVLGIISNFVFTYGLPHAIAIFNRTGKFDWKEIFTPFKTKIDVIFKFSLMYILLSLIVYFCMVLLPLAIMLTAHFGFSDLYDHWLGYLNNGGSFADQLTLYKTPQFFFPAFITLFIPINISFFILFVMGVTGVMLVSTTNVSASSALKLAFSGGVKNILPISLAYFIAIVGMLAVFLTLGLGILVYYPVCILAAYFAFIDIYGLTSAESDPT